MGKSCWMASLALQQLFPIQILLIFPRFELLQSDSERNDSESTCKRSGTI